MRNDSRMNSPPPFTLRIRTEHDQDIGWKVQPDEITFHQVLEVISRIQPETTVTAFQYVDEDGERITVRSDDELKAMFQMYFSDLSEDDIDRGLFPPLVIYPKVPKTPQDRNIHHLKIKTTHQPAKPQQSLPHTIRQSQADQNSNSQQFGSRPHVVPMQQQPYAGQQPNPHASPELHYRARSHNPQVPIHHSGAQTKSQAENIRQILTCGSIVASDLQQIELLGKGNGGLVYKAFHIPTQRLMAVKIIELDINFEAQRKILSELDILYRCESPNIIGFYGAFFLENRISICTEFMDGGSLDKYGQVPEDVLGRIALSIVKGLLYMWSLKILHRDVKPSNILVNTQGEVKLCDFGVSTQLVESIAMTYIGTNAYMAPERLKGEDYGAPSEVWSLGVTVFELATGEFPFKNIARPDNLQIMELCKAILEENPPELSDEHFSPELVDFVARCLRKDPTQRISHSELLMHPFLQKYTDDGTNIIAAWVSEKLSQHFRKSHGETS